MTQYKKTVDYFYWWLRLLKNSRTPFLLCLPAALFCQLSAASVNTSTILTEAATYLDTYLPTLIDARTQRFEFELQKISPRLKINRCDQPLSFDLMSNDIRQLHRSSIKVSCRQPKPWSFYLKATIKIYNQVVVSAQPVPRNTILQAEHLTVIERPATETRRGHYSDISALVGSRTQFNLRFQQVIAPHQIKPMVAIERGDRITILAKSSQISVKANGIALDSGQIGERIRVKNMGSNKVIRAIIHNKNMVITNF